MRRLALLIVFTNDHIERSHGLLRKALHRVVLEAGGLREGVATVEGTHPSLVRSFIFLVSQASDVAPVLLTAKHLQEDRLEVHKPLEHKECGIPPRWHILPDIEHGFSI